MHQAKALNPYANTRDALMQSRIPHTPTFEIKQGETLRFGLLNLLDDAPEAVTGQVAGELRRARGGRRVAQVSTHVRDDDASVIECLMPSSVTRGLEPGDYVLDFVFYSDDPAQEGQQADESLADVLYTDTILIRVHPSVTRLVGLGA